MSHWQRIIRKTEKKDTSSKEAQFYKLSNEPIRKKDAKK